MTRERCINRELTIEVIVGAFMVTVLFGLAYFTIILSRGSWFQQTQSMEVVFDDVMGLREGDVVICRGMPVGKVQALEFRNDEVRVRAMLEQPLAMRRDYRVSIAMTSVLGGRQLEIDEGTDDAPRMPPQEVYHGQPPNDVMADTAEVVAVLKKTLVDDGAMRNIEVATRELRRVSERLGRGEGSIGKLLSDDATLYDDLSETVASLKAITARIERGEGTLGKLMAADTALYDDLAATAAALRSTTAKIDSGKNSVARLLADDARLYRDLSATVGSLKEVASRLEQGQGVLGKLMTDDALYEDIRATVDEIQAGIEDVRETTPVTTFTSIFFGAL